MDGDDLLVEFRLVRDGSLCEPEVVETKIEPTFGDEDWHVRIELHVDEELLKSCGSVSSS